MKNLQNSNRTRFSRFSKTAPGFMSRTIARWLGCGLIAMPLSIASIQSAKADLIIYMWETGGNVEFSHTGGTLDLTGLTYPPNTANNATQDFSLNSWGILKNKELNDPVRQFNSTNFSSVPSSNFAASSANNETSTQDGAFIYLVSGGPTELHLAKSDITGDLWEGSGSATFSGKTLGTMGLTAGTWKWTLNNTSADQIILNIGSSPVPEPSTAIPLGALLAVGLIGTRRRRRS